MIKVDDIVVLNLYLKSTALFKVVRISEKDNIITLKDADPNSEYKGQFSISYNPKLISKVVNCKFSNQWAF